MKQSTVVRVSSPGGVEDALTAPGPFGTPVCLCLGRRDHLRGRLEDDRQCILVLIGVTPERRKGLLGFQTGFRESAQSWRELLLDLKGRKVSKGLGKWTEMWSAPLGVDSLRPRF